MSASPDPAAADTAAADEPSAPPEDAETEGRGSSASSIVFGAVAVFFAASLIDFVLGFPIFTGLALFAAGLFALVGVQWLLWRAFFPSLLAEAGTGEAPRLPSDLPPS